MLRTEGAVGIGAAVPSLARWGCSADADLVYRALVTFGPRTGRALGQDLDFRAGRVDRAIQELVSVDALVPRRSMRGAGTLWSARPTDEVVAALRRRRWRPDPPAERRPAVVLPTPLTLGDGLRHLPTRASARARLGDLLRVASHDHLSMHPDPVFEADSLRAATPMDRALLARGVRMRTIGVLAREAAPILTVRRMGAERRPDYRQAPALPMKLIVVDRRIAFFPVDPRDLEKGYLEVTQAPVVSALVALFERQWGRAWDPREEAMADLTLSGLERALIALLASGHTDVSAARELRISARSVSNILRGLMDRLGVENRFQLGLALGALRIVPPPRNEREAQ